MFVFAGKVECTKPSGNRGRPYSVRFTISLFPPRVSIGISDSLYRSQHVIENSRFNFQCRDSYADLLARDAWTSVWYDRYQGDLELVCPTLNRIPAKLSVRIIASWDEPFCVIEFKQGHDFCQVCTRPRAGHRGWIRVAYENHSPTVLIQPPRDPDPSSSSNQIPDDISLESAPRERNTLVNLDDLAIEVYEESHDTDSAFSPGRNQNLSSIENASTIASVRDTDCLIDYHTDFPVEIDFERVDTTPSYLGIKVEVDGGGKRERLNDS